MRRGWMLMGILGLLMTPMRARARPSPNAVGGPLDLEADSAHCTAAGCVLLGEARLWCEGLEMRADRLEVRIDGARAFAGSSAQGHVVLRDGPRVLTAEALELGADRITAQVDQGRLRVRRPNAPPPTAAQDGPFALTLEGDLQRDARGDWRAREARFTLCDCGPRCPPSWQLAAPEVRVRGQRRAFIVWPQLRANLFGLGLRRITPPLLPVSVPLTARAPGMLVPQVSFFGPSYPTLDVPVFLPLGPSWDLTVTPGVRGDWGWAPRLGARVRGAPAPGAHFLLETQTALDMHHRAAARYRALGPETSAWTAADASLDAQRRAQVVRADVRYNHQWTLVPAARPQAGGPQTWALSSQAQLRWLSDDAVLRDMALAAGERVTTYVPSRLQLLVRHPNLVAEVGADTMLRLDSSRLRPDGTRELWLSNSQGAEALTLHRLPHGAVHATGRPLGRYGWLDGTLMAARYGRLGPSRRPQAWERPALGRPQQGLRGVVATTWQLNQGPVRADVRAALDGLVFATEDVGTWTDVMADIDARAQLPLIRRYQHVTHQLSGTLRLRALARPRAAGTVGRAAAELALDPTLHRTAFQQGVLGITQLWRWHAQPQRCVQLELAQPLSAKAPRLLQPEALVRARPNAWSILRARVSVAPWAPGHERLQDVSLDVAVTPTWLGGSLHYVRAAPQAERFARPLYALRAPRDTPLDAGGAGWAHLLTVGSHAALGAGFRAQWSMSAALAAPGMARTPGAAGSTMHDVQLAYTSPCDCWGITAVLSASPRQFWATWRTQVLLTVADFKIGR